jgi:hypothetical protein
MTLKWRPQPWLRRAAALGLAALLLALAGCGLAAYEDKMRGAQKRLARFEEENRTLGQRLIIPAKEKEDKKTKQKQKLPLGIVFFRPPRGISSSPEKEPRKSVRSEEHIMYQYLPIKPTVGKVAPPAPAAAGQFMAVELAFQEPGQKFDDFKAAVLLAFPDVNQKYTEKPVEKLSPQLNAMLLFSRCDFNYPDQDLSCSVWVLHPHKDDLKGERKAVAVVYWTTREGSKKAGTQQVIDMSLDWLASGAYDVRILEDKAARDPLRVSPPPIFKR